MEYLLTNGIGLVIICCMEDIPNLNEIIVPELVEHPGNKNIYIEEAHELTEMEHEAMDLARQKRVQEIAKWAEKKKIFNGSVPPQEKQLNRIFRKLKKGLPIIKAIRGVCSYPTWNKWKQDYPEVAAMEEHALAVAVDRMLDKKQELSERPGTHMGEIARDKIQMDELQNRIDRIDRLTEIRNKKNSAFGGSVVPIQINFGFGKK